MDIHIGKLIKKYMIENGIPINSVADCIYKSRQNMYDIFKRKTMDVELLDRISMALNINLFEILAKELEGRLGDNTPKEINKDRNLLSFINHGDDRDIVYLDDNGRRYYIDETLVLNLAINGVGYYTVQITLPSHVFPDLLYSYTRAIHGPLKGLDEDDVAEQFFPWLEKHCPRQAQYIKDAIEDCLTELLAEPDSDQYREILNYLPPFSMDSGYRLLDNQIDYLIEKLPDSIYVYKHY